MISQELYRTATDEHRALRTISSIADGRFAISSTELLDSETGKKFVFRDDDAPWTDVFLTDIDGLVAVDKQVSVFWLWCLSRRPIPVISDAQLLDPEIGIKVIAESEAHLRQGMFIYQYTKPIMHSFHRAYRHVPGVSRIIVSEDGEFRHTSNRELFPSVNNWYKVEVENDMDKTITVTFAELAMAAKLDGTKPIDNSDIVFLDGDETNLAATNLAIPEVVDATANIVMRDGTQPTYLKLD
ncbi:hypothetical protein CZP2022_130 [Vibrio phage C-ZP2022]|nr:hypothetical protein CZP2022_130 [Vibrio phage C-ZP2022]